MFAEKKTYCASKPCACTLYFCSKYLLQCVYVFHCSIVVCFVCSMLCCVFTLIPHPIFIVIPCCLHPPQAFSLSSLPHAQFIWTLATRKKNRMKLTNRMEKIGMDTNENCEGLKLKSQIFH